MAKYHSPRLEALTDWLRANNINPDLMLLDADLTIDDTPNGRMIRVEVCVPDEHGRKQLDERGERVATEIRTVPLLTEPPVWFEPYEKPTREQLLATVDRVRALHRRNEHTGDCEHCSAGDYPNYSVPSPCPTIRALNGEDPTP